MIREFEREGRPGKIPGSTYYPNLRTHVIPPAPNTALYPQVSYCLAGGFGTLASESYGPIINSLTRRGTQVVVADDRPLKDMPSRKEKPHDIPLYTHQRATDMQTVLEALFPLEKTDPQEKVVVVAHSRGNQGALIAVARARAKVDQFLSANAPGYADSHHPGNLMIQWLRHMISEGEDPEVQANRKRDNEIRKIQIGLFPWALPVLLREAIDIADTNLFKWVILAKQKGIDLHAIISKGDTLFTPEFLKRQCEKTGIPFHEEEGPHGAICLRRYADTYADLFLSLLPS